ncbi:MAG: ATP-binding cassette domain-containing protein [Acidimicrobiales bacterium]
MSTSRSLESIGDTDPDWLAPPLPEVSIGNLEVRFGGNTVLKGCSAEFGTGFHGLIGPNGAGKTTLFNVIGGFVRPHQGEVTVGGVDITTKSPATIAADLHVARTFQTPRLVPELTVCDNVALGTVTRTREGHLQEFLGTRSYRSRVSALGDRVDELLEAFDLSRWRDERADELPLGSQKLVEVARCIVAEPSVMLLDEVGAGLSAKDQDTLIAGLASLIETGDTCVLFIEHNVHLVLDLCPTVAVLHLGEIIFHDDRARLVENPDVIKAYLGGTFRYGGTA